MLDKVTLKIEEGSFPLNKLTKPVFREDGTYSGHFKGFRINQDIDGVRIAGSIPKYYAGSNVKALTRHQEKEAFKKLEDETGLSLKNAKVIKLEVGDTLLVKNPPPLYLMSWGCYGKYRIDSINNGESIYLSKDKIKGIHRL